MKRKDGSDDEDCSEDDEGDDADEERPPKRVRSSAASGFDRLPQEAGAPAAEPLGLSGLGVAAAADGSLVTRTVKIPPNADVLFLQRLLGPDSAFPNQIKSESSCACMLSLGQGQTPEDRSVVLHVTGKTIPMVESSLARIRGLFQLSTGKRDGMLAHFCGGRSLVMSNSGRTQAQRHGALGAAAALGPAPTAAGVVVASRSEKLVKVPQEQVASVMTVQAKRILCEATGVDIEWEPPAARLQGTPVQIGQAETMIKRVVKHCLWGASEAKVLHLLEARKSQGGVQAGSSVRVRLSPMDKLKPFEAALTAARRSISIGKGAENDVVVADQMVSRKHCVIDLDSNRGGVYITDLSTNGTFLNSRQLPNKSGGKVVLWHGDELLLKSPQQGHTEFGYTVNLYQI